MPLRQRYDVLFFDLDGTLTDSAPGILAAVDHALVAMGAPVPPPEVLRQFIGPPLTDSFTNICGFSPAQVDTACGVFREYYAAGGLFENSLFDGIVPLLDRLQAANWRLMVATSKPQAFAERILEHFGLLTHFERVSGASMDESRNQKWQVIDTLLTDTGLDPARCLMIGDRRHDVEGARRCGLDCLGVLYGYGDRAELEAAGATYLAESVEELGHLLLA